MENIWMVIPIACVVLIVVFALRQRNKENDILESDADSFIVSGTMSESNKDAIRASNTRRNKMSGYDDDIDIEDAFDTVALASEVAMSVGATEREARQVDLNESGREKTGLEISDSESRRVADTPARESFTAPEPVRSSPPSYDSGGSSYDSGGSSDSGGDSGGD